jgi:hypothetical protein
MPAGETLQAFLFHDMKGSDTPMPEDISNVEIARLRKENERLISAVNEFSIRFAAVKFRAYEMAEEIRRFIAAHRDRASGISQTW